LNVADIIKFAAESIPEGELNLVDMEWHSGDQELNSVNSQEKTLKKIWK